MNWYKFIFSVQSFNENTTSCIKNFDLLWKSVDLVTLAPRRTPPESWRIIFIYLVYSVSGWLANGLKMTSSHRNFSGVECCLHTNRLRVFTTRLGGRNNTNSIFSYMTRVILKMLIVLYVYVFKILHLFFCPASNFNTCLLVIIKFFSALYTRILVYGILQDIYIQTW